MLTASFIQLVAQQDLLKLTTTRQTSGKLLPSSVLMPFSISTFTVIEILTSKCVSGDKRKTNTPRWCNSAKIG